MAEIQTQVYNTNDWERGTRGSRDSFHYEQCYLKNVRLYPDGSLGPRPRWKQWTGDHLTPATLGFSNSATIVPAVQRSSFGGTVNHGYLVVEDTNLGVHFVYDTGSTTATVLSGVFGSAFGPYSWISRIGAFQWLIDDFHIDLDASTIATIDCGAAVQTAFAGARTYNFKGSTVHQGSAFFWGPMINGTAVEDANRLYYSDPYAYGTFTSADQFIDVDGPIAGCASIGSSLLIWTEAAEWFLLQGRGDPAENTLNTLGRGRIPEKDRQPARFDNVLVFRASDRQATVIVGEDGEVDDKSLNYLINNTNPGTGYFAAVVGSPPVANSVSNSVAIPYEKTFGGCHHNVNGVWTEEQWGINTNSDGIMRMDETQSLEVLLVLNGSVWTVYERPVVIHSPEPTVDSHAEVPDGDVFLPRIQLPNKDIRPVRIIIDAQYWRQDPFYPTINIDVSVADADGSGDDFTSVGAPTDVDFINFRSGSAFRYVLKPNDIMPFTPFFIVRLTDIASVTIQQVTVEYEISDQELI